MVSFYYLSLFFAFGFFLQKRLNAKNTTKLLSLLNHFILYISLPSLIFVHIIKLQLNNSLLVPFFSAWGVFFFSSLVIIAFVKFFNYSKEIAIALILSVALSNSSFLGFPLTLSFFGSEGLKFAIIYDQLGSFLILSTLGLFLLALQSEAKFSFKRVIIKVLTFPSFIALVAAFWLRGVEFNSLFLDTLEFLGSLLTIVAFLVIGLSLKLKIAKEHRAIFIFALALKLFIAPLSLFLFFKSLDLNSLATKVSVFEAAMAPMITSSMLAILYNIQKELVSSILGYGIILSFFTLPLIFAIIS